MGVCAGRIGGVAGRAGGGCVLRVMCDGLVGSTGGDVDVGLLSSAAGSAVPTPGATESATAEGTVGVAGSVGGAATSSTGGAVTDAAGGAAAVAAAVPSEAVGDRRSSTTAITIPTAVMAMMSPTMDFLLAVERGAVRPHEPIVAPTASSVPLPIGGASFAEPPAAAAWAEVLFA